MPQEENKQNKDGIDLSGALKDSDTDAKTDAGYRIERSYYLETPKIIQWIIKYSGGLVKNEKQASYAVLGIVVLATIISLFLVLGNLGGPNIPKEALQQPERGLPVED